MLRDLIFSEDPYVAFPSDAHEADDQGWGSDHPLFGEIIRHLRPLVIIEVGSWKGRSALNMARTCKALQLRTEILCVDTWLGSPEHWRRDLGPNHYPSLKIRNGYPQVFYTFMKNVIEAGMQDVISPLPMPSHLAAIVLARHQIVADMIYIDGAHDYRSVAMDLDAYAPLLADEGVMLMDDYGWYRDTTQAIHDFVSRDGWHLSAERKGKAVLSRRPIPAALSKLMLTGSDE